MKTSAEQKNPKLAMLLGLIPGLGQFYNGQNIKALMLFLVFILEVVEWIVFGGSALVGLVTLGDTPVVDHSLFMLIQGSMQLIMILVMVLIHAASMRDAKTTAERLNNHEKVPMTFKETFDSLYENGFPYLLIIPLT